MVICAAVGCGSNYNTSKELNVSLYRLPREEALKFAWKQKSWQENLPADENIRVWNHLHDLQLLNCLNNCLIFHGYLLKDPLLTF